MPCWFFTLCCFFFFNDTATTEIYTLSLHDALPISTISVMEIEYRLSLDEERTRSLASVMRALLGAVQVLPYAAEEDRKSTRLNSSHANISYAVFCLKKKQTPTVWPSSIARVGHLAA